MPVKSYQGPYLSAALLCEKVLVEQDGVKSAIRIIDRVTRTVLHPNPPPEMEPWEYDVNLLLKFKAGRARGVYPIKIEISKPSGERSTAFEQSVFFEGEEDRGVDIVARIHITFNETGIYWLHIYLRNDQLTQIPFRVVYMPQVTRQAPNSTHNPPQM